MLHLTRRPRPAATTAIIDADRIPLDDLGLDPDEAAEESNSDSGSPGPPSQAARSRRAAERRSAAAAENITYLHIHEDELMTIGIFRLPEGARIPLHNHPGMTVFSRLLFGSLHLRAYDWEAAAGVGGSGSGSGSGAGGSSGGPARTSLDSEDDHHHHHQQQQQQQHHHHHHHHRSGKRAAPGASAAGDQDWSECSSTSSGLSCSSTVDSARAARLVADTVLTAPTPSSVLFPADGELGSPRAACLLSPPASFTTLAT